MLARRSGCQLTVTMAEKVPPLSSLNMPPPQKLERRSIPGRRAGWGQLFDFILAGVGVNEIGSASGVLEAVQQLSSAIGVAALGTIFFSAFAGHLPTHALAITAWACLAPVTLAFALIFRLPLHAREPVAELGVVS